MKFSLLDCCDLHYLRCLGSGIVILSLSIFLFRSSQLHSPYFTWMPSQYFATTHCKRTKLVAYFPPLCHPLTASCNQSTEYKCKAKKATTQKHSQLCAYCRKRGMVDRLRISTNNGFSKRNHSIFINAPCK